MGRLAGALGSLRSQTCLDWHPHVREVAHRLMYQSCTLTPTKAGDRKLWGQVNSTLIGLEVALLAERRSDPILLVAEDANEANQWQTLIRYLKPDLTTPIFPRLGNPSIRFFFTAPRYYF
jgi:hypothetical protein